jgi:hypothetical protein
MFNGISIKKIISQAEFRRSGPNNDGPAQLRGRERGEKKKKDL